MTQRLNLEKTMMKRTLSLGGVLFLLLWAYPVLACGTTRRPRTERTTQIAQPDAVFLNYENARLALLEGSLRDVQAAAKGLANAAERARRNEIRERALALQETTDLAAARTVFAALSEELIEFQQFTTTDWAVAYCPIEEKRWIQPTGRIENPYGGASMRRCGEFVDAGAPRDRSTGHQH